jgi:STE24 endopeptidase
MNTLTTLFLLALTSGMLVQLWLYRRHDSHVRAHRGRVPDAFADQVELHEHQKAADYTHAKVRLAMLDEVLGTALLLIWTLGGGLALVLGAWDGAGLTPLPAGAAAMLSVLLIQGLLDLPLSLWRTFRLEQRFGFNRTTIGQYFKDKLLGIALALLLGGPLLLAMLWLMEQAGELWWLYAWLLWMGFSLFITWLYPTLIAPLFNKFEPLSEGELKDRIQGLIERCGFTNRSIFVMDGSRRSAHGNAYFTGFGRSKRIVFFDTLVNSLGVDELEAVLAHELGHFKHRHVQKHLLLSAVMTLLAFAALGWLMQQPWFYAGLGVDRQSDAAALLLFMMASPAFTWFLTPLGSWLMRRHEFEADAYAVKHTGGRPLIDALVKLYQENASTLTPDPMFSAFHDSHPPAPVRIAHISAKIART